MKKKCNRNLIIYELRNLNGNIMPHFFGIVFPNLMCLLLSRTIGGQASPEVQTQINTSLMLTMALIMPMAIMLLGYGCLYSSEIEKGIPLRMRLFGFDPVGEMTAKIIAHLIFLTLAFLLFGLFQALVMGVQRPAPASFLCLMASLYLLGIIFLIIAHAIANIVQKFSVTFAITMFLYFIFMILTGMMGIRTDQLPTVLQKIAATLPMTYISSDFIDFWQGGSYNFMPFLQSFLFLGALSGILLLYSLYRNKRRVGS